MEIVYQLYSNQTSSCWSSLFHVSTGILFKIFEAGRPLCHHPNAPTCWLKPKDYIEAINNFYLSCTEPEYLNSKHREKPHSNEENKDSREHAWHPAEHHKWSVCHSLYNQHSLGYSWNENYFILHIKLTLYFTVAKIAFNSFRKRN